MSTCCHRLEADHRQTRAELEALQGLLTRHAPFEEIDGVYQRFRRSLIHHLAAEEHGLFPVLSQYRPMVLMEVEHDDLQGLLGDFETALTGWPDGSEKIMAAFQALSERLHAHMIEEESGIFPLAEEVLEPEEKALVSRKLEEVAHLLEHPIWGEGILSRATPTFRTSSLPLSEPLSRPVQYQALFEAEHTMVQSIALQAGAALKPHWSAQHQYLILLAGQARLQPQGGEDQVLRAGETVTLEPRLMYGLVAETECRLLVVKVWPRPYFVRKPPV